MNSRARRIHNFRGNDQEYITYLESLVLRVTPPSPPYSDVRDEAIDSSDSDANNPLVIIEYQPGYPVEDEQRLPIHAEKKKRPAPRWEKEIDEMIGDIPPQDWSLRRKTVGISSEASIFVALDILIHGVKPQRGQMGEEADTLMANDYASDSVLHLLDTFALATASLQVHEAFTTQVLNFRVFVFVSLCCVALHNGAEQELVDKIMQKCVSDSCQKNLTRLRNGALWVNRMMAQLAADGFSYLAYELFVLWGQSIAKYGRFADAGDPGFSYFRHLVPKMEPKTEIQASIPFWPPFIIKAIVGDTFSLPQICVALGYGSDPQISAYPDYLNNYCSRQMPLPKSADQSRDSAGDRIQTLLEAAQQSDSWSQSIENQQMPLINPSNLGGVPVGTDRSLAGFELGTELGWANMSFFNDDWTDLYLQ